MSGSGWVLEAPEIGKSLGTLLAAHYGARQLARDLDRFPKSITAEDRTRIFEGVRRLEANIGPVVERIGRMLLSVDVANRIADAVPARSAEESAWHRFFEDVAELRDTTGKASRKLR